MINLFDMERFPYMTPYQFSQGIAYNDSYDSTLSRITTFQYTSSDAILTFIIPSINRSSLKRTLYSIIGQTSRRWNAIIIFDACIPTDIELLSLLSDPRILWISIQRHGSTDYPIHSAAGNVRNIGMNLVCTPWIGFVDDDDTIAPQYIEKLLEEISITPTVQAISFRMLVDNTIVPRLDCQCVTSGQMGISFAIQSSLLRDGIIFKQSDSEDFNFMKSIFDFNKKIVLSPYLVYYVNQDVSNCSLTNASRTEIN